MQFAEVFLRLGCSLVAWMVVYTWVVWLAALEAMGCGPSGDEMHHLLLWLAPPAAILSLLLRATRPFREVHRILSWPAVPIGLLLIPCLRNVVAAFREANLGGMALCGDGAAAAWQLAWAPVQAVSLLFLVYVLLRQWREARRAD